MYGPGFEQLEANEQVIVTTW